MKEEIILTPGQKRALEKLWFVNSNNGKRHTNHNHSLIQGYLEAGEDRRSFYLEGQNTMKEKSLYTEEQLKEFFDENNDKVQRFLSSEFNLPAFNEQQVFREELANRINDLIERDFMSLVNILYRIDVSESNLKKTLHSQPKEDAGKLIADVIIKRQLQKIKSRDQFRSNLDIDEQEKW